MSETRTVHGTHAGYVSGCTCELCREGERVYQRAYRKAQRARDRSEVLLDDECPRCGRVVPFGPNMAAHVQAHARRDNERIPSGQTQTVEAERLRPGDLLVAGDLEPLPVETVKVLTRRVRLETPHRRWYVPKTTKFVRHIISRRIDTRPDLRSDA